MTLYDLPQRDPRAVIDRSAADGGHCRPTILHPRAGAQQELADRCPLPPGALLGGVLFLFAVLVVGAAFLTFLAIVLGIAWEWIAG